MSNIHKQFVGGKKWTSLTIGTLLLFDVITKLLTYYSSTDTKLAAYTYCLVEGFELEFCDPDDNYQLIIPEHFKGT